MISDTPFHRYSHVPFVYRCHNQIHREHTAFPQIGCCSFLDTLVGHEEIVTKGLVGRMRVHPHWKTYAKVREIE